MPKQESTSWETSETWYDQCVGEKGHYYHQSIILPSALRLLEISKNSKGSLLDLGCGQGVLARYLPDKIDYIGLDLSASLIRNAQKHTKQPHRQFLQADITTSLPLSKTDFDWAAFILSLQNIENAKAALTQAAKHLKPQAKLLIVLNHPCFRIPRQSHWDIDSKAHIQYRRLNLYMSPLKIPIQTHPGQKSHSQNTYSFHHPLSHYTKWLSETNFSLLHLEEWCSDKQSEGSKARMENRARKEFPLFLALVATKL